MRPARSSRSRPDAATAVSELIERLTAQERRSLMLKLAQLDARKPAKGFGLIAL